MKCDGIKIHAGQHKKQKAMFLPVIANISHISRQASSIPAPFPRDLLPPFLSLHLSLRQLLFA